MTSGGILKPATAMCSRFRAAVAFLPMNWTSYCHVRKAALQPLVGIGANGDRSAGLYAQIGDYPGGTVEVGERVVMAVNVL